MYAGTREETLSSTWGDDVGGGYVCRRRGFYQQGRSGEAVLSGNDEHSILHFAVLEQITDTYKRRE
jgi:hypothetical protein